MGLRHDADTLTYSYTNNNQLTGVTHTNGSFSNESFTWDTNGNETGTGYTTGQTTSRPLAWLHLHVRQCGRNDVGDADVNRRRVDVRLRFPGPHGDRG